MSNSSTSFPTIWMETLALQKLQAYYKFADREISGLGIAQESEGDVVVSEVLLFDQESSYSETELDPNTLAKWLDGIIRAGYDPSLFRLWWHKHPIEGWSSVDDKNIEGLNNGEWLLSIVKTPSGLLGRLDLYSPFHVTLDQLNIRELRDANTDLEAQIQQEVKDKVKTKVWQSNIVGRQGEMWTPGSGVWVKKGNEWVQGADDQKKLIITNPSPASAPSTSLTTKDEQDKFFEALADRDWESYYEWSEQQRLLGRD